MCIRDSLSLDRPDAGFVAKECCRPGLGRAPSIGSLPPPAPESGASLPLAGCRGGDPDVRER
eukprot:1345895-Alexandrium_andersonii.AAC.1